MKLRTLFALGLTMPLFACQEAPEQAPIRSLRASGQTTFVCIGHDGVGHPLTECPQGPTLNDGGLTVATPGNELYALVTQTDTAEVAVVRLTGITAGGDSSSGVIDVDKSNPGVTPLRVGVGPIDIVTTPGGMASFVGVSDPGREGIFGLPTTCVGAPSAGQTGRDLTTWPACRLPAAPGDMVVVVDSSNSCGTPASAPSADAECPADLSQETSVSGSRKLLVALPDLGKVVTIDAQTLLNRPPGSFDACPIEAEKALDAATPQPVSQAVPSDLATDACGQPEPPVEYSFSSNFETRPAGFALDGTRLFVADQANPRVHVLDVSSPCAIEETDSLIATSFIARDRVVTTSRVAVSPLTTQGQRFLYAIDEHGDGSMTEANPASVMIFDISPGQTQKTPVVRTRSFDMPFEAPDRIEFVSAAKDVAFSLHDLPIADPVTGTAVVGTYCNPDPNVPEDSPEAEYRNDSDYDSGAGPNTLRGVFGFVLLSSGRVAIIDVEDFDAKCRRPQTLNTASSLDFRGCSHDPTSPAFYTDDGAEGSPPTVTNEVTCHTVEQNRTRSGDLVLTSSSGEGIGAPSLRSFPRLSRFNRSLSVSRANLESRSNPLMLGVDFASAVPDGAPVPAEVYVGTGLRVRGDGPDDLVVDPRIATQGSLVLPYGEPRAYPRVENVTVTFEGALAGDKHAGFYDVEAQTLTDQSAFFCDLGVQDRALTEEMGVDQFQLDPTDEQRFGKRHTDYVQIISSLLPEEDTYWSGAGASCGGVGYQACLSMFGEVDEDDLAPARDLTILEAFQDRLKVEPRGGDASVGDMIACCFPDVLSYRVRAGNQWVVRGSVSGFRHTVHAVPEADGLRCRRDCAPWKVREQGRVFEVSSTSNCTQANPTDLATACAVGQRDPDVDVVCFRDDLNQGPVEPGGQGDECIYDGLTARFVVYRGLLPSLRDMQYAVEVQGGFAPALMSLTAQTSIVLPVSMQPIPGFNQLAVVDSQDRGLLLLGLRGFNGGGPGLRQSFF